MTCVSEELDVPLFMCTSARENIISAPRKDSVMPGKCKSLAYSRGPQPHPRPWTGTGSWPVRNRAAQQEVSGGRASKVSSVFTASPITHIAA